MREIILSGHVNERISELARVRQAKDAAELLAYDEATRARNKKIYNAYAKWKKAVESWWKIFGLLQAWVRYKRATALLEPNAPWPNAQSKDEITMRAGQESENAVAHELEELLPGNAWVLIRGYHNKKGEIDQILVGPAAIIAMEIKYRKARVFCSDDDSWEAVKLDNWGNYVEKPKPMTDKKGRSPSRQVLEPSEVLSSLLKRRNMDLEIIPVVVLSHPMAAIGDCDNLSVRLVTIDSLDGVVWKSCRTSNRYIPVEDVVNLIVKDHEYWQRPPQSRAVKTSRIATDAPIESV